MVVQGLAGGLRPPDPPPGGLRPPGPPVSAQHWVDFLEHFYLFSFAKLNQLGIEKDSNYRKVSKTNHQKKQTQIKNLPKNRPNAAH